MTARLAVRLTPRAKADALEGWSTDASGRPFLNARVRARPVEGQANAALEALVAGALGLAKSNVRLAAGGSSRLKHLIIEGLEDADVARRLGRPGA
jgi:uncharacterized protein YggU (UPF0235/DUF167 family)